MVWESSMKIRKILFYILVFIMLIGGVMGIIKGLIPNMAWLNFRHLLGFGETLNESTPAYAVIYGIVLAALEITSAILLLARNKTGITFAIVILSINALGCIIAILLGDLLAIGSLLLRFSGFYILRRYSRAYRDETEKHHNPAA